jgi:hypothetical protein
VGKCGKDKEFKLTPTWGKKRQSIIKAVSDCSEGKLKINLVTSKIV